MAITDPLTYAASGSTTGYGQATEITTPGTTPLVEFSRAIYIGGAGDLEVVMAADGAVVTLTNLLAGTIYRLRVSAINVASTATGIVALY